MSTRSPFFPSPILLLLGALPLAVACEPSLRTEGAPAEALAPEAVWGPEADLEVWTLAPEPRLEIGVREGAEPYQLHRAQSSALLQDGRIVVLNSGSQELRFFDHYGTFLHAVGGDGEGPGEFRYPTRVRLVGTDSLLVWDQGLQRVSYLDLDGTFLGAEILAPSPSELFPGDDWLFGERWIDSPVPPLARAPIQRMAEAIPAPPDSEGFLFLWVTRQGRIWASTQRPPAETGVEWRVFTLDGRVLARMETPPDFEPHEIGEDYILGRFQDDMDVNYVHLYELQKPRGSEAGEGLSLLAGVSGPGPDQEVDASASDEVVVAELREGLINLARLQEMNYAENYSYTSDLNALFADPRIQPPEGIRLDVLLAKPEGWIGLATHEATGVFCGLAYGYYVPMGWIPGSFVCP